MLIIGDVNMKTMNNLEKELISQIKNNDQKYSLSKGLLIASGLSSESEIDKYMEKLDQLTANFKQYLKEKHIGRSFDDKTKALSQFLWSGKKLEDDNPRLLLPSLIDICLNKGPLEYGNCISQTSLYSIIGYKQKINLKILKNWGHFINGVMKKGKLVHIDHVEKHSDADCISIAPLSELIAATYISRGCEQQRVCNYEYAEQLFTTSLQIYPDNPLVYLNLGIISQLQEKWDTAAEHYENAAKLDPDNITGAQNYFMQLMNGPVCH